MLQKWKIKKKKKKEKKKKRVYFKTGAAVLFQRISLFNNHS